MAKRHEAEIPVTASSGNVFADLGFAEPEEELTKAKLVGLIWDEIERRGLTQKAAADLMGIDQPKVSALMNGKLANFSSERLMHLLNALGKDVNIAVTQSNQERGRIHVIGTPTGTIRHIGVKPTGRGMVTFHKAPTKAFAPLSASLKRVAAAKPRRPGRK